MLLQNKVPLIVPLGSASKVDSGSHARTGANNSSYVMDGSTRHFWPLSSVTEHFLSTNAPNEERPCTRVGATAQEGRGSATSHLFREQFRMWRSRGSVDIDRRAFQRAPPPSATGVREAPPSPREKSGEKSSVGSASRGVSALGSRAAGRNSGRTRAISPGTCRGSLWFARIPTLAA